MSRSFVPYLLGLCAVGLLSAGCSSSGGNTSPTGGDAKGADTDEVFVPCSEPVEERPAKSSCLKTVSGKVQDSSGKPIPDLVVSVCGSSCFFGKTEKDGSFTNVVGQYIETGFYATLIHGRPNHASLYIALPVSKDGVMVYPSAIVLPTYPASGPRVPLKGGSVTAGDITLTIPADSKVEFDIEDVELGDKGEEFKAVKVDVATPPPFAAGTTLAALYAFAPFDMRSSKPMPVSVANTTKLAAGTNVEFVVVGNELLKGFNGGALIVAAKGKVSADGKTIDTLAGQGLSSLTWLGIRAM